MPNIKGVCVVCKKEVTATGDTDGAALANLDGKDGASILTALFSIYDEAVKITCGDSCYKKFMQSGI